MKNIIILGGSYAGVQAGKVLHKAFKKDDNVKITLIDKRPFHTLMTELHEVAGHRTEPDSIQVDLRKIFGGKKVDVVIDEINDINFDNNQLISNRTTYSYDYLILATGNVPNFFGIPGEENAFTLWSYEDAVTVRNHVEEMFKKASIEPDAQKRKTLLTFAVCGGGFTGVEMVGELGEAKKHLADKYMVNEKEVTIYNIEAMDRILNMLKSDQQVKTVEDKYYKKLGITLLKNTMITRINEDSVECKDGSIIPTHTLIWAAGIQNNEFAKHLGLETGRAGRIIVNEYMQVKGKENIYAAGDNAAYQDEAGPMPQIVEAAEQSAHTAALNIIAAINGTDKYRHTQNYHGFMVSVGSRQAVADTGFKSSGWSAMLIKHCVNFLYLFSISGVRQLWNYLMHEFFHVKNRRSFVGGHFSKASPNFWLVPLRVWVGYMWLVEGIKKISEGWLREVKIVYIQVTDGGELLAAASEVIDVTSSASETVDNSIETLRELPFFAQWVVTHMPGGYGEALLSSDNWIVRIMNNILESLPVSLLMFMQVSMIILELVVGVCLIVGLFTCICSVLSVVMTIGITMTGMSDATILWYTFAGIALIGGSGSTFGLDYYVLPKLKKWWSNTKFAKSTYLYID